MATSPPDAGGPAPLNFDDLRERLGTVTPRDRRNAEEARRERLAAERARINAFMQSLGARYAGASFASFEQPTDPHRKACEAVKHAATACSESESSWLVLCGPTGAGKYH